MQHSAQTLQDTSAGELSATQLAQLQQAVASLNSAQLNWASGYLAGLCGLPVAAEQNAPATAVTVLYATQGGNAQSVATELATRVTGLGYVARVQSVDEYRARDLAKEKFLVVAISTQGDGDAPESAQELMRYLGGKKRPALNDLRYAVFGLGDSSYEFFCKAGHDLDTLLQDAGATPLLPRVDADVDFHSSAQDWYTELLKEVEPVLGPPGGEAHDSADAQVIQMPRHLQTAPRHDRNNPLLAEVVDARRITSADALNSVHHLSLAIDPQRMNYQPGDAVGVWFRNDPELVEKVLQTTGHAAAESVEVQGQTLELGEALAGKLELTQLHPLVIKAWAAATGNSRLDELAQDAKQLREFASQRQFIDLILDYPGEIDAANLATVLQPMQPRLYSIASSQAAYEDEIHLTVSTTQYHAHGRDHEGGASGFLTRRIENGDEVPVYIAENTSFRLPEDGNTPLIMVGSGSGIAPFRGFLQEREVRGDNGANWLVFGNRHFHRDFLYQTDWLDYRKAGLLERVSLAFSRDTSERIYVQDRLREEGAELLRWLEDGARIYVCGGVSMEKGVVEALHQVVREHGDLDAEQATQYIEDLRARDQYLRDVY